MQVLTNGHNKLANILIEFKGFIVHLNIFPGLYSIRPFFAFYSIFFSTLKIYCVKKHHIVYLKVYSISKNPGTSNGILPNPNPGRYITHHPGIQDDTKCSDLMQNIRPESFSIDFINRIYQIQSKLVSWIPLFKTKYLTKCSG